VTIWGFGWYATFCLQALPPLLRAPAPVGLGLAFKPLAPFLLGSSSLTMAQTLLGSGLAFCVPVGAADPLLSRGKHAFAIPNPLQAVHASQGPGRGLQSPSQGLTPEITRSLSLLGAEYSTLSFVPYRIAFDSASSCLSIGDYSVYIGSQALSTSLSLLETSTPQLRRL